jgi:hypothetical protein
MTDLTKTRHDPAPFEIRDYRGSLAVMHASNGAIITTGRSKEELIDNFAVSAAGFLALNGRPVYAAAPRLLDACRRALVEIATTEGSAAALLRAAIAEADPDAAAIEAVRSEGGLDHPENDATP